MSAVPYGTTSQSVYSSNPDQSVIEDSSGDGGYSKNEEDAALDHRAKLESAEGDSGNEGAGRVLGGSEDVGHQQGTLSAEDSSGQGWLSMRPDMTAVSFSHKFGRFESWFSDENEETVEDFSGQPFPDMPASKSSVPGSWPGSSYREDAVLAGESLEKSDAHKKRSNGGSVKGKSLEETGAEQTPDILRVGPEQDASETHTNCLNEIRKQTREMHMVMKKLAEQNQRLVSELEKSARVPWSTSPEHDTPPGTENEQTAMAPEANGPEVTENTVPISMLESSTAKAKAEARRWKDANAQLKGELSETQKQLETKAELLWEQDYELRDYKAEVQKLNDKLMNCISVDDDDDFVHIRDKTTLEKQQEKKQQGKKIEELELKIRNLENQEKGIATQ